MNQIVNMVMRMVMRRVIGKGISAGMNALSKGKSAPRGVGRSAPPPTSKDREKY
ncbi:hypothetical protein [Nereida sp. NH-UV-3]|uniref:hypothetical protein n=1 Tax=Nereida TaxID=282198 RepID=UPI0036F3652E